MATIRLIRFNPTMVRLRRGSRLRLWQSQCPVSIPLWCDCALRSPILTRSVWALCFNPTMVRLRPHFRKETIYKKFRFNPTMVRLRLENEWRLVEGNVNRFNPTMVRLRPAAAGLASQNLGPFQSHYGAIAPRRGCGFQSPLEEVSIPLWCDCASASSRRGPGALKSGFNPTMVRLRPISGVSGTHRTLWFQSHYGAIAPTLRASRAPLGEFRFQSHYGAIAPAL